MNLLSIRNNLKRLADNKATNQAYLDDLDMLINQAYLYIWTSKPWNFAQKQIYFNLLPDIVSTSLAPGNTAAVVDFSRDVAFLAPIFSLTKENWQGAIFECQGREYEIQDTITDQVLHLKEPYRGLSSAPGIGLPFTLKKRNYDLPQDCVDILSIGYKDAPIVGSLAQHILPMTSTSSEMLSLLDNRTGSYATHYIQLPPSHVPSGEKMDFGRFLADVAESNVAINTYQEFCWTYMIGDKIGPLSEPLVVQSLKTVALYDYRLRCTTWNGTPAQTATFDSVVDKAVNPFEGRRKIFFFNANFNTTTGVRLGLPKWVLVTYRNDTGGVAPNAPTSQYDHLPYSIADTAYEARIRWTEMLNPDNPAYIEVDGQYQAIKFYPRPQAYDEHYTYSAGPPVRPEIYFKQVSLRYIYKPEELALPTDVPRVPYEMHQLIVYKAMEDLMNKLGNSALAAFYRSRYEQDLGTFEKKYIDYVDTQYRSASSWGRGVRKAYPYTTIVLI